MLQQNLLRSQFTLSRQGSQLGEVLVDHLMTTTFQVLGQALKITLVHRSRPVTQTGRHWNIICTNHTTNPSTNSLKIVMGAERTHCSIGREAANSWPAELIHTGPKHQPLQAALIQRQNTTAG